MISILVPVYNAELHIEKCIRSILDQTFRDFELILLDDGSTDKSGDICDRYALVDPRVRVIHTPNRGVGVARNELVASAKGENIGFVDSDDYIEPNMFSVLQENLEKYHADISICGSNIVTPGYKANGGHNNERLRVYNRKEAVEALIENRTLTCSTWDKLFRATLFSGIRFGETRAFEDMLTIYKLFELSDKIVYDPLRMYNYVITRDSLMRSKMSGQHLTEIEAKERIAGYIGDKYPDLKAKAEAAELISKLNICNRILCESPEMGELYDSLVKEVRAGAVKILQCGFADSITKLMALTLRVNERLYRGCIRILYRLIKGK